MLVACSKGPPYSSLQRKFVTHFSQEPNMTSLTHFLSRREKFFASSLATVLTLVSLGGILLVFASATPAPAEEVLVLEPVVITASRAS